MSNARRRAEETKKNTPVRLCLISVFAAALFFALLLLMSSAVLRSDMPATVLPVMTVAAGGLSAFVAGFAGARAQRSRGLATGALYALPAGVIAVLASMTVCRGAPGLTALIFLAVTALCGAVGGVLAVNLRKK